MQDVNTNFEQCVSLPAVQYEPDKDFLKRNLAHEGDSAIMHFQRKSWARPRGNQTRSNREALATLLTSAGESSDDCIEKLLSEEIQYPDLVSLTHTDLEHMGFKDRKQRQELLDFFRELPNQDPTYDMICQMPEAQFYNRDIISNANEHLENMRSAVAAANYKLKIMPAEDIIVGEKSFASRFVLEALDELLGATDEIDHELANLEDLALGGQNGRKSHRKPKPFKPAAKEGIVPKWLVMSSVAAGVLAALWFYKNNLA